MATVQLSNLVVPQVYLSYTALNNVERLSLMTSGVITRNAQLDALANGPSKTFDIPFWKDLDPTIEPDYANDDPADLAVPGNITTGEMIGRKVYMAKGYSAMDLAAEVSGENPMQQIRNRFGTYWSRQFQRRLITMATGVLADNVANDGGDMIYNASIAAGLSATAPNLFSRSNFTAAAFTMGDAVDGIVAIAVHSVVYKRMIDNDDIDFIPDSQGSGTIATYLGRRVIVDDGMPVVAGGTNGFVYTSILFGAGAFGYGMGTPEVPVEVDRKPDAGNGGGMETLWERKTWLLHPFGYKWIEGSLAEFSPTLADLRLASHWDRQLPSRKQIPLAFLKTNG